MAYLEIKNFSKSFGRNHVIKDINFTVEKGEVLAVLGSSGGGKTTLLRCLNFLEKADEGIIRVDGKEIFNASLNDKNQIKEARKYFGLVFQQFNLFPQYTVLENIKLAPGLQNKFPEEELDKRARELIERVGLTERIGHYPSQLSGGQQQRVAIARALIMEPDILCFDEPTSALDPELTGEVLRVIKSLKSVDRTMLIVTHEMNFARDVADKVIFIDSGVIDEMGTPEEVIDNPSSMRAKEFFSSISN